MLNFNWWVNRKDPEGRNVFAGGFLGLDNIGVFDRSAPLPTGGHLDQADGTAWMAFYCLCMLEIALILTEYDPMYEEIAFRFLEHFVWITYAMDRIGDEPRRDVGHSGRVLLRSASFPERRRHAFEDPLDGGTASAMRCDRIRGGHVSRSHPRMLELIDLFRKRHPEVLTKIAVADDSFVGYAGRRLASVCNKEKLQRILAYMLDENEFLSPYGIRSLSKYHLDHPFVFHLDGQEYKVQYLPAESNTGMFGGNSNWRGPIWMPVNGLHHSRTAADVSVLWRRLQSRMPDRIGKLHDVV